MAFHDSYEDQEEKQVKQDIKQQNDIEKQGLKLACPPGVKLSILPVQKAAENILAGKYDSQRLLIVARYPERFLRLVNYGVELKELNVGNMSQTPETRSVTRSINVVDNHIIWYVWKSHSVCWNIFRPIKNQVIPLFGDVAVSILTFVFPSDLWRCV